MICFHFTIFVVLETTIPFAMIPEERLWFAFILLSLSYWKQRNASCPRPSVRCDLLSFYYLCRTGNNNILKETKAITVVICFHFTIFVVLETTTLYVILRTLSLWFAFILLSLSYWKQRSLGGHEPGSSCDLLSFYYLCRTGNNR